MTQVSRSKMHSDQQDIHSRKFQCFRSVNRDKWQHYHRENSGDPEHCLGAKCRHISQQSAI